MNIQLFNFLEDYSNQIVKLAKGQITKNRPAYKKISDKALHDMLEQCLDGYIDLLVTGQTDNLDRLFQVLSRVLAVRGSKFSDVFEVPLVMSTVIRRLLVEEYSDLNDQDAIRKFSEALEQTEKTAHHAACRFLDVFHEFLNKRINNHNKYLARTQKEFGINLSNFRIEPEEP